MKIEYFNVGRMLSSEEIDLVAGFLYTQLEQFGDPKESIIKAIDYAMDDPISGGGLVAVASVENKMVGVVVMNSTGMEDYIPENILVYIAVHRNFRGRGVGKKLLQEVIKETKGDIALHVEADNPAFFLYRNLGFNNKYLEMRLIRKEE